MAMQRILLHASAFCQALQNLTLDRFMTYLTIKTIHVTCAVLSISFFVVRGFWMLFESDRLQKRWVKVAPHIIDTVLLGSALVMVFWSAQYPFVQPWLTAKVVALIVYIVLGSVALKRGKTEAVRMTAFIGAILVFAYIVMVALTRQPMLFSPVS